MMQSAFVIPALELESGTLMRLLLKLSGCLQNDRMRVLLVLQIESRQTGR